MKLSTRDRGLGVRHGAAIALLCAIALYGLQAAGAFELLDLRLYDFRYLLRGERPASASIRIVEMDDRTFAAYGISPLPRSQMALLLSVLTQSGARAVGVDIQFIGTRDAAGDSLLAAVSASHPDIVHTMAFFPDDVVTGPDAGGAPALTSFLERHGIAASEIQAPTAESAVLPFPALLSSAGSVGHVTVEVDPDGTIRRVPFLIRYRDRLYPALALRLFGVAGGDLALPELRTVRAGTEVRWPSGRRLLLPKDAAGAIAIDFAGDRASFRATSMMEVLARYRTRDWTWLRRTFAGEIVLVGTTARGQATTDLGATPFAAATPLLFVHANALDSLLRGRLLSPAAGLPYGLALVAGSIALGCLFVKVSLSSAFAVILAWLAVGAGVDWALYRIGGLVMPPTMWMLLPAVTYAAVESYRLVFLERRTREREKELRMARAIQRRLLPNSAPAWKEFDLYGVNLPAREVGGDYYDWLELGEGALVLGLGDVSGKGVAAALLMSHLHASLHASIGESVPIREAIRSMHLSLYRAIEPGKFATFFLALLTRADETMRFCNAGHNPGVLVHDGEIEMLSATGLPLGAIETAEYEEVERRFQPGDLLVLYSDGITECPSGKGLYGEERLVDLIRRLANPSLTSTQIGEAILEDVRAFSAGDLAADDVTLLVARRR